METCEEALKKLEECIQYFIKHIFSFYIEDVIEEKVVRYVSIPTPFLKKTVEFCEHVMCSRDGMKNLRRFGVSLRKELFERENKTLLSRCEFKNTFYFDLKKERMRFGGSFLAANRKRLARHTKEVFKEWEEIRSFFDTVLSEIKKA